MNLLHEALPNLLVLVALLLLADITQKYFVFRLLQQAKDEKEREAIIAATTRRR